MLDKLMPDFIFDKFDDVTPEFLKANNIEFLLIDIDNTLAPYEEPLPGEHVERWFKLLEANGIKAMLVSNNHPPRVELFNKSLGLPAYADCKKPSPKRLRRYADVIGAVNERTAALGDQIFTDVWGAKMMGARAILVPPIRDKKTLFVKAKRFLERPIIKKYRKIHEVK